MCAEPSRAHRATHSRKDRISSVLPKRFAARFQDFLRDEDGPVAVEYAIMIAMIIMACFATIRLFGGATAGAFDRMVEGMEETFPEM
jgi:pilus assembly protein Flp/PilA